MVRVIMALQGHGKTKQIIELANQAAKDEHNTVVFIERGNKLTYDVSHRARLIDISIYRIEGFGQLKTFCGRIRAILIYRKYSLTACLSCGLEFHRRNRELFNLARGIRRGKRD